MKSQEQKIWVDLLNVYGHIVGRERLYQHNIGELQRELPMKIAGAGTAVGISWFENGKCHIWWCRKESA